MPYIEKTCPECEKLFTYFKQNGKPHQKYCSRDCAHAEARRKNTVECTNCKEVFVATQHRIKKSKTGDMFCSTRCRIICHREEKSPIYTGRPIKKCLICGNKIFRRRSKATKYCSKRCFGISHRKSEYTKGRIGIRGTFAYEEWRIAVTLRDDLRCVLCGDEMDIAAHHVLPIRDYPELVCDEANGITLCRKHHALCAGKGREYTFAGELADGTVFTSAYMARWERIWMAREAARARRATIWNTPLQPNVP